MVEIICNVNIENYWCELCCEYTICNRVERYMEKHGLLYLRDNKGKWGRLSVANESTKENK